MNKQFIGDVRVFICINTIEYNNDGQYAITTVTYDELANIGFDTDDNYDVVNTERTMKIDDMRIGDIVEGMTQAFLIRVA